MSVADPNTPLYAYVLDHQPPEHAALRGVRESSRHMPNWFMQIAPDQGHFMALLLRLIDARQVLELGTFTGYSALAMAMALPPDGRVVTCDVNAAWVDVGRPYWESAGVAGKIDVRLGPATETLARLVADGRNGTFDAAFVDADKENYLHYYEACLGLVRPGGLVIVDNVLRLGHVIDETNHEPATVAIRELNRRIATDDRVDRVMLPIGDGITLVRRR